MKILKDRKTLIDYIERQREMGKKIGFAPTMGALHQGHISLYKAAKEENDEIIASIFINPTQFNNIDDLNNYPQTLEEDLKMLEDCGVDSIYVPSVEDLYPEGLTSKNYDFDGLELEMEGKYRPGHFNGVGTVVEELFRQVQPHNAYFGEKDFQQLAIIKKLVEKLHLPIKIHGIPTYREKDGLAMSSRNLRLTEAQRKDATLLYSTLLDAKNWYQEMPLEKVYQKVQENFTNSPLELEYFIIADEATLKEKSNEEGTFRAFITAHAGEIRLIDNMRMS